MSVFEFVKQPLETIREFLEARKIELRETEFADVFIVKFTQDTDVTNQEINHLKGLIFNHKTETVLSMTYPVPIEVKDLPLSAQEELFEKVNSSKYTVERAVDGCLLRLAYFPDQEKWVLSTNGKEDAYKAYWMNGVSFGKMFDSVVGPDFNYDGLNKDYVYLFVMAHQLNVIVVNHENSKLYHVTTYDRTSGQEVSTDLGFDQLPTYDMTIIDVVKASTEASTKPVEFAGYMVHVEGEDGVSARYRFENANYTRAKELRGNSNNIDFTILVHMLATPSTINEFIEYYPIYEDEHTELVDRIRRLAAKFYREYGQRYKDHQQIFVHPRHHSFLGELHQTVYKDTLKPIGKTVQFDDIHKYLMQQPAAKLLYLLNYIHFPQRMEMRRRMTKSSSHNHINN
jgi:hypothetical protein